MVEPLQFSPINMEIWPRRPYFDHYFTMVRCSYSISCELDITDLLASCAATEVKFYPAIIHCIAHAVNQVEEMRVCFDKNEVLGTWNYMSPSYAIFHTDDKTFSNIWTPYTPDFQTFNDAYVADMDQYGESKGMFPKPNQPDNCFTVSSLPWVAFTGFNINVFGDGTYLRPIFTIGKYTRANGRTMLPLAVQLHHAVCDGFHASQLLSHIAEKVEGCRNWMQARNS